MKIPASSNPRSIRLLSRASSTASRMSGDGSEPGRRAQRSNSQSSMLENDEQSKRLELLNLQINCEQWKIQVLQNKSNVQQKKIEILERELRDGLHRPPTTRGNNRD